MTTIATTLTQAARKYNKSRFIELDPIQFPHKYQNKRDIEISAFVTSWISFGSRDQIIKKAAQIDSFFNGSPYEYIKQGLFGDFKDDSASFYRTLKGKDYYNLCKALQDVYSCFPSLESLVSKNIVNLDHTIIEALEQPFHGIQGVPDPAKGSACKRLCMFLRWMVRRDKIVDFGIWELINPEALVIPLDTHVHKQALELGIISRKSPDMKAAQLITDYLKTVFHGDPTLGDFALFGLGIDPAGELAASFATANNPAKVEGESAKKIAKDLSKHVGFNKLESEQFISMIKPGSGNELTKGGRQKAIIETTHRLLQERRKAEEELYNQRLASINATIADHRALIVATTYNIIFSTKVAANAIYALSNHLAESGLLKHIVKKQLNDLLRVTRNFEKICYSVYGARTKFLEESVARVTDEIGFDIEKLFFSIKMYLDKHNVENSAVLSRMEQARTLISLSVEIHKTRMRRVREINPDLPTLDYLCMDKILRFADILSATLNQNIQKVINLNDDPNCTLAVTVIDNKLANEERIARAILLSEE